MPDSVNEAVKQRTNENPMLGIPRWTANPGEQKLFSFKPGNSVSFINFFFFWRAIQQHLSAFKICRSSKAAIPLLGSFPTEKHRCKKTYAQDYLSEHCLRQQKYQNRPNYKIRKINYMCIYMYTINNKVCKARNDVERCSLGRYS